MPSDVLSFKDEKGKVSHEQMLLPTSPVTEWAFVGNGAAGALLVAAGFPTLQALRDADVDDATGAGPVQRLNAAMNTVKPMFPTIKDASWPKLVRKAYNAFAVIANAEDMDAPTCFKCPLSLHWMHDPVITPSGFTYERSWIERWVLSDARDPQDRRPVTLAQLIPNRNLQDAIQRYRAHEEFLIVPW
jgi:hypothetical protein